MEVYDCFHIKWHTLSGLFQGRPVLVNGRDSEQSGPTKYIQFVCGRVIFSK